MDDGPEPIHDDAALEAARRQARTVHRKAVLLALALLALTLILPA